MKRFLFLISALLFAGYQLMASATWNYTVSTASSSPISMTGATALSLNSGNWDDGGAAINWPFSFQVYDDVYSTSNQITMNTNGYIRFDGVIYRTSRSSVIPSNSGTYGEFLSYGGNTDGAMSSTNGIKYLVSGTAPNRVFTLAFTYYTYYNYGSSYHADIQVSFYEADHKIAMDFSNVGGSTTPASYLGINAGDGTFGNDIGTFPTSAVRYIFTPGSALDPPQSFTATTASSCQINLAWQKNAAGDDVIVAENSTNSFGTPANGTAYSAGSSLGSATVIYVGSASSYQHQNLSSNSNHYYKIWSKSSSNIYSATALSDNATTNPVTAPTFTSATAVSSSQIDLQWVLNTYGDNVMLTYNTVNDFAVPQDGLSYAVGNQIGGKQTVLYKGSSTTYSHTGLSTSTTYYYKIYSYGCQDDYSAAASNSATTQAIANPTLTAVNNSSSCSNALSWTKNGSGDDVMILANTSNSFGTPTNGATYVVGNTLSGGGTVIYNGSGTSYTHSGLSDNTTWYYKAFSVDGSQLYSSGTTANAATTTIGAVPSLTATAAGSTSINLSWTKNTAGDDVIILTNTANNFTAPTDGQSYSVGNTIGSATVIYKGSATSYTHSGLAVNSTHYYKAYSLDCYPNYSTDASANATTSNISDPTVSSVSAQSSCTIALSWSKNSSGDDVMVLANTSNTFGTPSNGTAYVVGYIFSGGGEVIYNGSATSFTHSGLDDNTHYYYKFISVTSSNYYSSGASGDDTTPAIGSPTLSAAAAGSTSINLSWTKNTAGDDVIILTNTANNFTAPTDGQSYSVGSTIGSATVIYKGSATSYTHSGLAVSSTHYYKAYSLDCTPNYSTASSANATTSNISNPTVSSVSTQSSCTIALSWAKNSSGDDVMVLANTSNTFGTPSNGTAYVVGYTFSGGGEVIYNGSGTSFTHSGLIDNTHYYYKFISVNSSDYYSSGVTGDASTTTINDPAAFSATAVSSSAIDLSWTKNTAGDDVIILTNTANSFTAPSDGQNYNVGSNIGSATVIYKGSAINYTHSGLTFNSTHYYKVYSYDCGLNYSTPGLAANATTQGISAPQAFSVSAASSCKTNLSWTKNAAGDDVMIAYNTTNSFATPTDGVAYSQGYTFPFGQGTIAYVGSATSYQHSPLFDNTKYYYKIWSKNSSNFYSTGILDSTTTNTLDDPSAFTATTAGPNQINLSWSLNGAGDNVMVVYNTTNSFATPVDGISYSTGNQLAPGQGVVLYKGSATLFNHSGLNLSTTYYYKVWSYDCAVNYSTPGQAVSATTSTVSDPQSFTATAVSSSEIDLSWLKNTAGDDVMIAYNTSNNFATPSNGISYPTGNQIASGQGTVIYNGSSTAFNHTGLNMNTVYYYKIWSKDANNNYSTGIVVSDTTLSVDDPQAFSATMASSSAIDLSWTKNTSGDSVMIVYNTSNTFATPTNGFSYVIGNQIASGQGTVIYRGPATAFTHNGLSASTKYYYKAYSYNSANYYSSPGLLDSATTDFPGISSFPYLEDFETQTSNQGNIFGCQTYFPLTSGWNNVQSVDDIDWVVRSGKTPTGANGWTGPTGDHTTGNGKYIYTESTSCYNKEAWLISPLFNFTSLSNPRLEFYYHMHGSATGSITVQISTDGGTTWSTSNLYSKSGQQQPNQTDPWGHADISLASYAGMANIKLRIKGTTGYSWSSDMAIDDIRVYQPQNMVVSSVTTEQDTVNVVLGAANQEVIRVKVVTVGAFSPLTVGLFGLSTNGTQSLSDISNAKVFYTGNNPSFSTTQQYGSTVSSPNGAFPVSGSLVLSEGVNYFWITYDIPATATIGHYVDAECSQVIIGGVTHTPTVSAPAGTKSIVGQVTVGTGTSSTWNGPVFPSYYYGAHESVYLASELGTGAKEINKIAWYKASGSNTTDHIDQVSIYMKNATGSTLSSGTYSTTGYTLVYQGQMPNYLVSGWIEVNLNSTFLWDGTSNLHVLVVQQKPATNWGNYPYWAYTTVSPTKARRAYNFSSPPSSLNATNQRPNVRLEYVLPQSMSYASSTVIQNDVSNVPVGQSNAKIIGIKVVTQNTANPLTLTKLKLSTLGTTSASDIASAKVYYTGTSATFATGTQYGSTVASPSGTFFVNGSQVLQPGDNYFWLAYDISSNATVNNVVDATCDSVYISGAAYQPVITNPNGSRTIKEYITIGNGTNSDSQQPLHYYQYHAWEAIYTSSEMGSAKDLSALAFYKMSGTNTTNPILNVSIYIKHTTDSVLSTGTYSTTGYTQVYSGNFPNNAPSGWMEVPFTNPFSYNGTDNLEVLIVQNYGAYFSGYPTWAYRTVSPNRARYASSWSSMPTSLTAHNRLANIRFEYSNPMQQSYVSSTVTQNNTSNITAGINDQEIIGIEVVTQNSSNPLSVTSFSLNTNGSSNAATDITAAKIYYTGGNPNFTASNQFGSTVNNPNGSFTITGSQSLQAGTNYFWLAYDLPATATTGNWVDGECTAITVAGQSKTPSVTAPIGNRTIVGALHGIYTIGPGGDYSSFTAAVNDLNNYGVSSWVKFKVLSGTYTEQISLSAYTNASASNTVTFESNSGDSTDVVLQYNASSSLANYTLRFSAGSYYKIKNMTIKALSSTYGRAIDISASSSYIDIENNVIEFGTASSYNATGIYAYNSTVNNINIKHNKISSTGGYGFYLRGASSTAMMDNIVVDSNIISSSSTGAYLMYINGLKLRGNEIAVSGGNATYGVYSYYNPYGIEISGNTIISGGSSSAYGVYLRSSLGNTTNRNSIYNNFISQTSTSANIGVGLYSYNSSFVDIYFNNFNLRANTGNNSSAVRIQGGSNNVFKNNMAIASNGGVAIYVSANNNLGTSDYNNLYSTGSVLGYVGNSSAPNLASWKSLTGEDAHSIQANPNFTSNTDLHVTNVSINNLGTPIAGITQDIDGDVRHATTPDIGADEFSVDLDVGITAILSPVSSCNGSQQAEVTLKNFGQNTVSSATINWTVDGTLQTAYSWTGSLTTSQSQNVVIGSVNLTAGTHTLTVWSSSPNGQSDQLVSNDTSSVQITITAPPIVDAGNDTSICNSSSFTTQATASGYSSLQWSSSGSGTFVNSTSLNATYTPSAADIGAGSVYLKLTAASTGCSGTEDSLLLVIVPMPAVSFSGLATAYCPGDQPDTLTGLPAGGQFTGAGMSGNIFDPSLAGAGTHTIKYVYAMGACSDSATQTTTVHPSVTPLIANLKAGYCLSSPADTLSGTPAGGTWSGSISSNIFNPATVGVGNHSVTYTYVDPSTSCSFDTTYQTQVYSNPTASISGLASTYCDNTAADTLSGLPAGGYFTGNGMSANVFDPALAGTGTHVIQYIINNGAGCSDTASQNVTVNSAPVAAFSGLAAQYCSNDAAASLSGTPAGGTFSGSGVNASQFDPSAASIGVNWITYSYTSTNGCTDTAMQSTTVNQTPVANAGVDVTIINGHDTILYGSASGGSGSYAYSWGPVSMLQSGQSNMAQAHTVALTTTQIYTLMVTDNVTGCSSSDQTTVNVTGGIFGVSSSANPLTICAGDSATISAVASGGSGTYSYLWSSTPAGYTSAFASNVVYPSVTTTYTVLATDGTSFSSSSVVVNVNPLPSVSLSGVSGPYCSDADSVNMIGLPAGGIFSGTGVVGSSFYPALAGSGTHQLYYQYTDGNGCTSSDTLDVIVNQTPVSNAGSDQSIGYNTAATLTGSASGGANYAWSWSPAAMVLNPYSSTTNTVNLTATQIFTLVVSDTMTGCNSADSVVVTVTGGPLSAIASASPSTICAGSTTSLAILPSGGNGTYTYSWSSNPSGYSSTLQNPTVSPLSTTTYTVTVSSGTQTAVDSVTVTVNSLPVISLSGLDTAYCVDALADTLVGSPAGVVFSGAGMTNNVFDPSLAGAGYHQITMTYTDLNSSCSNDTIATTHVVALPVVNAGTDVSIATGHDTILYGQAGGASSLSYQWQPASLVLTPNNDTTQTTALTSTTLFTLMATDNIYSCSNSDDILVTVYGGVLSVSAQASPDTLCAGDTSNLLALASGGSGTYSYTWSSNPAGFTANTAAVSVTPSTTTTYTVQVNDNGNTVSSSVVVHVNALPQVSFSGLNSSYCSNDAVAMLTGIPAGGTYSGTGVTGSQFDPASVPAQGSYDVRYTYVDANGCSGSDIQTTAVYEAPVAHAGSDVTIAAGHDTLLYGSATGGGNYAWGWSPPIYLINASVQNPQTVAMSATQIFTLTVSDTVSGCSDNDDVIVYVGNTQLSASITAGQSAICSGDSTLISVLPTGGTGTYTFSWSSVPAGFSSSLSQIYVKPAVTTLYSVTVDDGVNTVSKNITISVNPKPAVALVGLDSTHCLSDIADTLYGFPAGGLLSGTGLNSNLFEPSIAGVGTHYVTYTFTDANGCSNTDTDTTVVHANPVADAGIDVAIMVGHDTTLYGQASGGSGTYSYYWSPGSLVLNPYAKNATTVPLTMTNMFTLTVSDLATGCTDDDDVLVTVYGGTLMANPTATPDTVCYGDSTQLHAMISGGSGTYTYQWSSNPAGYSSTQQAPRVSPAVTTTFTVVANDGANSVNDSVVVVVETKPVVAITSYSANLCENGGFDTLQGSPYGGVFFGTGVSGNLFDPTIAGVGNHQLIYSYSTAGGCHNSDTVTVNVLAAPVADAGSDIMIPCGGSGLIGSNSISGLTYLWTPADSLADPTASTTIASPAGATIYTLTVSDTLTGCSNTDDVLVDVIGGPTAVVANDTIICKGESTTLWASGGTSYQWSNGVTSNAFMVSPSSTTVYTVTVSDGTCYDVDSISVTVNAPYVNLGPDIVMIDTSSFILDAGYGFVHYLWNTGDTLQSIRVQPYVNASLGLNVYGVAVMDGYGCIATDSINITYVLSVDEIGKDLQLDLYPNPSKGMITMKMQGVVNQRYQLDIMDVRGESIYHDEVNINQSVFIKKLDLRTLPKGVYMLRLMNKGLIRTYKLVIQ